jgi:hypothetical protein
MRTVLTLLCGVTVLLCVAGCAIQGGVEVEGGASQVSPPPSPPTLPSGTPVSADPVAILRADPQLDAKIKGSLVPCEDGSYPVDDRYVDLTHDGKAELVITLFVCSPFMTKARAEAGIPTKVPGSGYAAFVYNLASEPPVRLFAVEDSGIQVVTYEGAVDDLILIRDRWAPRDDPCCPTDQELVRYQWDGTTFIEVPR